VRSEELDDRSLVMALVVLLENRLGLPPKKHGSIEPRNSSTCPLASSAAGFSCHDRIGYLPSAGAESPFTPCRFPGFHSADSSGSSLAHESRPTPTAHHQIPPRTVSRNTPYYGSGPSPPFIETGWCPLEKPQSIDAIPPP